MAFFNGSGKMNKSVDVSTKYHAQTINGVTPISSISATELNGVVTLNVKMDPNFDKDTVNAIITADSGYAPVQNWVGSISPIDGNGGSIANVIQYSSGKGFLYRGKSINYAQYGNLVFFIV